MVSIRQEDSIVSARNEVFRKAGRNLYLYQQIEKLLKFINVSAEISGYISDLEQKQKQKSDDVSRLSMGSLVGQFIDNIYSNPHKQSNDHEALKEPYFSMSIEIQADSNFIEQRRQTLKSFVDDRNYLVHHLFIDADINSVQRCEEIEIYLDKQRESIIAEHEQLSFIVKTYTESAKAYSDFVDSDEGEHHFKLLQLQQSDLARMLIEVSIKNARADGWTLLNHAGNELRKVIPNEMTDLKRMYGFKTLKGVMLASELFDMYEEETDQGTRLLYRTKVDILSEYLNP